MAAFLAASGVPPHPDGFYRAHTPDGCVRMFPCQPTETPMDAIDVSRAENACISASACGSPCASRSCVPASDAQPCASHGETGTEISKSGWGGSRANAGGARPGAGRPAKRIIEARPSGPRWHVAEIVGRDATAIVRDVLEGEVRRGYTPRPAFESYLPQIANERLIRGVKQTVLRAMFPGYLFVRFDRQADDWGTLVTIDGLRKVIATRTLIPVPLPSGFVEKLMQDEPERLKLPAVRLPCFDSGQRLKVEEGPFTGFPATCVRCDGYVTTARVHVFGREMDVEFPRRVFGAAPVAF